MTTHNQWFKRVTNGDAERTAAMRSGITTSTLNRQLAKGSLSAELVIAISRGYGISPVTGLAATGFLTSDEAAGLDPKDAADLLTDQQLVRNLALRIDADPAAWFGMFGEMADEEESVSETHARLHAVNAEATEDDEDMSGSDDSMRYAANRRRPEPEEGDDDYGPGA